MSNIKKLNPEQTRAVEHEDGPLLIVAGAGTGKTTVLINRLNRLIEKKKAKADEILLLTFTDKASQEMEGRALERLPYGYVDLWINTFHSFCERILRDHGLEIGLNTDFKLLSDTEQWILIKKNLSRFNLNYYSPLGNPNKFIIELVRYFSRLKDEDVAESDYLAYAENLSKDKDGSLGTDKEAVNQEIAKTRELADAYHLYNRLLLDKACLDFGDLIRYTIRLFRKRPNILAHYRKKFKYLMVDEFQDTNWAQYELLKNLLTPQKNLCVVGDDDQSIYKFRGASLSNIMQFKDDFPEATEVILNKNYRSGRLILDKAYGFIRHNDPNRLEVKLNIDKNLTSEADIEAEVKAICFENSEQEKSKVAEKIISLYKADKNIEWSDFAILARSNSAAEEFSLELKRQNIPNVFVSLKGLYRKEIIMDCLAYFRLLDNYHESSALFRVLNMENFKVGHADIITLNKFARRKNLSLFEALKNIRAVPEIGPQAVANINKLLNLIAKHSDLAQKEKPSKLFINFIADADLARKDHDKNREYYSYLNQFYQKIKSFEQVQPDVRLKDFMELMDLELEAGEAGSLKLDFEDDDTVKIMTVHASKGLEFKYVFLVNLVDKRFPSINRKEKIVVPDELVKEKIAESKNAHTEEERRLFYVAVTRAKEKLFLTGAKNYGGQTEKKMSSFIGEAGIDVLEIEGEEKNSFELVKDLEDLKKPTPESKEKINLPNRFSFSQIQAYDNCPLQYKFNFILKIPVPTKDNFIFGRVMHNTLKDFLFPISSESIGQADLFDQDNEKKKLPGEDHLEKAFEKNWQEDGYSSKEEKEKYRRKAKSILKDFYKKIKEEDFNEILFLEKNFSVAIAKHLFRGAIDRIDKLEDGTIEIIDYKTGNPKKIDAQGKKQLLLYKIAVEEVMGLSVSKLSYHYLEDNSKVSFEPDSKAEEKLKLEIKQTIAKMKTGDFSPNPGMLCKYCDFRNICEFAQ